MEEVTLNLAGRDEKIAEYLNYIRNLGAVGIHYATYAHMGNGIWSSGRTTSARGYSARDGEGISTVTSAATLTAASQPSTSPEGSVSAMPMD